jgi:hypothetical protein
MHERLFPHLKLVTLSLGSVLYEAGDAQRYIYFPSTPSSHFCTF